MATPAATAAASPGRGFLSPEGRDVLQDVKGRLPRARSTEGRKRLEAAQGIAKDFQEVSHAAYTDKPFVGAQPKLLRRPEVLSAEEATKRTMVACQALSSAVSRAPRVLVVLGDDVSGSCAWRQVLEAAIEEEEDKGQQEKKHGGYGDRFGAAGVGASPAPPSRRVTVAMSDPWTHTVPRVASVGAPWQRALEPRRREDGGAADKKAAADGDGDGGGLLVYLGTPGKYLAMSVRSALAQDFDAAYAGNRLAVICRSGCMLPIGTQVENIYGTDAAQLMEHLAGILWESGPAVWGHAAGTKAALLALAYPPAAERASGFSVAAAEPAPLPSPLQFAADKGDQGPFEPFVEYVRYLNLARLSRPQTPVVNYYDTGMLVSVCMGTIADSGTSLLMDHDGLSMLRDASIGHTMSKLGQLLTVEPYRKTPGVYNFFIGDGAARLNGGAELIMHLIEDYQQAPLVTVFLFNNGVWAIEDNLVAHHINQHTLRNTNFYDLLQAHPNVRVCETSLELCAALEHVGAQTAAYLAGVGQPDVRLVIVRGMDVDVPPVIGSLDAIMQSSDMAFLRDTLGKFAAGCARKVPIYGCSAFEYIQFLDAFLGKTPEGRCYQYICGRTDIQAAHMAGFQQVEKKCVLMINDVYGINSLGESLRAVTADFQGSQLLVMIWHPSLLRIVDHFHLHRPPMVWPSVGPYLCQYYARTEKDLCLFEFEGLPTKKVASAIERRTPLIVVNMLPQHERNYVGLDIRVKVV